jgi:chemotaxis-related protein WspB
MLLLLFTLGGDRYALDADRITEVLPLVDIRPIPHAPAGVAGVCDLRGTPVPVIDLSEVVLGRPAAKSMSTRLVIVGYPDGAGGTRPLGVLAERATGIVRRALTDFVDCGVPNERAWHLGPVARDEAGLLQWIDITMLLPAAVRDELFRDPVAH